MSQNSALYCERAWWSSRYFCAFPSIHMVNENLKFGYEIAQVLLKIPSIASCAHEPSWKNPLRGQSLMRLKTTNWELARHDQCYSLFNWLRMWILRVHKCHRCPGRLHDLGVFVLDPHAGLACLPQMFRSVQVIEYVTYLVALTPPTI